MIDWSSDVLQKFIFRQNQLKFLWDLFQNNPIFSKLPNNLGPSFHNSLSRESQIWPTRRIERIGLPEPPIGHVEGFGKELIVEPVHVLLVHHRALIRCPLAKQALCVSFLFFDIKNLFTQYYRHFIALIDKYIKSKVKNINIDI